MDCKRITVACNATYQVTCGCLFSNPLRAPYAALYRGLIRAVLLAAGIITNTVRRLRRSTASRNNCAVSREDAYPSRLEPDSRADTFQRDFSRACDFEQGGEEGDDGTFVSVLGTARKTIVHLST